MSVSADPLSTRPMSVSADPLSTSTGPVSMGADPLSTSTGPVSMGADPLSTRTGPVSMGADPLSTRPASTVPASGPPTDMHDPDWHVCPAAQPRPHAPQFAESLSMAVQTPAQFCRGAGHPAVHTPLMHA
jgi:hypothetical protein